jgi:hypothetical protein
MSDTEDVARGSECIALVIAVGSSSAVPALIVELEPSDSLYRESGSQLAIDGLERMSRVSVMPSRATGWIVLARPGLDRIYVIKQTPAPDDFFGGPCAMSDDWLEVAARTGCCLLIIGRIGLAQVPDAAADPVMVTQIVDAAAGMGRVAGAMVPVYVPGYLSSPKDPVWPGTITYRKPASGKRAVSASPGFSIAVDGTEEFGEAASIVRAGARGMKYEWVRQRLAVELLLRGHLKPPRMVDQVARDIAAQDAASRVDRSVRVTQAFLLANWLAFRSVIAYILRRALPHWHIFGMHVIATHSALPLLKVSVDPWADELLAAGDADDLEIWLDLQLEDPTPVVVAYRGDYRVGILDDETGVYRTILMEPRHKGIQLLTDGIRSLAADGSWQLRVYAPSEG